MIHGAVTHLQALTLTQMSSTLSVVVSSSTSMSKYLFTNLWHSDLRSPILSQMDFKLVFSFCNWRPYYDHSVTNENALSVLYWMNGGVYTLPQHWRHFQHFSSPCSKPTYRPSIIQAADNDSNPSHISVQPSKPFLLCLVLLARFFSCIFKPRFWEVQRSGVLQM